MSSDAKSPSCEGCAFVAGLLMGFFLLGILIAWCRYAAPMDDQAQKAAVKAGKAEYYLDADSQRQWRWKP